MKAFLVTAAAVFGLITVVHIWRVIVEGSRLAREPWFVLMTLAAAALCAWAVRLLRLTPWQGPPAPGASSAETTV
jgi:hypothetical protein